MDVASSAIARAVLSPSVDSDAIDDAAYGAGWRLVNIIPGDSRHPRQLLYSVFDGGWLYLVDDARFERRWFQAEGARQSENLTRVRELLSCEELSGAPARSQAAAPTGEQDTAEPAPNLGNAPMPRLPRLADHVLPRWHEMAGAARLLLHDAVRGDALELTREQFEVVALAQGTRDIEGVMLEASRHGWLRRRSSVQSLFALLHERGELAGGIPGEQRVARVPDRPLALMPGLQLGCDGNGSCCRTYSSMLFSRDEAAQALSLAPPAAGRVFLPAFGVDDAIQAVSTRDGACLFLDQSQRCTLHAHQLKPRGCAQYPLTFIDDGESIHVTPVFECGCVQRSLLGELPAAVPELGAREAELAEDQPITRLASQIAFAPGRHASATELRDWTQAALDSLDYCPAGAAPTWLWSWLRMTMEVNAQPNQPFSHPPGNALEFEPPRLSALAGHVEVLVAHFRQRAEAAAWRSATDRTRNLVSWSLHAVSRLEDPAYLALLLSEAWPSTAERRRHAEAELMYLRCVLFGYQFALGAGDALGALRERCVRMLLARAMLESLPDGCPTDTSHTAPLTALEALLRSQSPQHAQNASPHTPNGVSSTSAQP